MTPLFKKLNYKNQAEMLIVNPPNSFFTEMELMKESALISTDLSVNSRTGFILAFVTKLSEVEKLSQQLVQQIEPNGVLWFAYPKQSSKKYQCDFNRDNGWQVLKSLGYEGVRMIAIDDDWSALRFRQTDLIKKTR
jgi:hypothetical protein